MFCCFRVLLLQCLAASVFDCVSVRLLNSALACSFSVTLSSVGLLSINNLHRDDEVFPPPKKTHNNNSIVAERAERTVDECSLSSCV